MTIFEKFKQICVMQMGKVPKDFNTNTTYKDLRMDSLDTLEMVMHCEQEFDIEIPDDRWELATTVGEAITLIQELIDQNECVKPKKKSFWK